MIVRTPLDRVADDQISARRLARRALPLSRQQQRVFDFVREHRWFPSYRAIADHMGWKNSASAVAVLHILVTKGRLTSSLDDSGALKFEIVGGAP